jgi:hypothetical protein
MSERTPQSKEQNKSSEWLKWAALGFVALLGLEFLD